jgi:hypothetical protein
MAVAPHRKAAPDKAARRNGRTQPAELLMLVLPVIPAINPVLI